MKLSNDYSTLFEEDDFVFEVSSIESLPSRLIARKIFCRLNSRQCLRLVSQRWKYIVEKYFGIRLKVNTNKWILKNSECNRMNNFATIPPAKSLFSSSFTKSLLDLEISGEFNFEYFIPILEKCWSLRYLTINLKCYSPSLEKVQFNGMNRITSKDFSHWMKRSYKSKRKCWLPCLEKCRIICMNSGNTPPQINWEQRKVVYFLFQILQSTKLRDLEFLTEDPYWQLPINELFDVSLPSSTPAAGVNIYARDVNQSITNYQLPVHLFTSLQSIKFHNDFYINISFKQMKRNRHMQENCSDDILDQRILSFSSSKYKRLKTFSFRIGSGHKWVPTLWWNILSTHRNLRELSYELHFSNEMRKVVLNILCNSQMTLKILKLHGSSYLMDSFDGGWFHRLINLEHLELIGETSSDKICLKKSLPMLVRPWSFPSTLKILVVHGHIDCGNCAPQVSLDNLISLEYFEIMGRYASPWFVSRWKPIFEVDLKFAEVLFETLSSLKCLTLLYQQKTLSQRISKTKSSISTSSFVKRQKNDPRSRFNISTFTHSYLVETMCSEIKVNEK